MVLVLWPAGGDSMVRVDGSWVPAKDWGPITGEDLRDDWSLVRDASEASRLVKEAMSSASDKPADSADALNAAS